MPALLAAAANGAEPRPFANILFMGAMFAILYFVMILPMRSKQKKLDELVKSLKTGDKVIINPGIYGTIVGVEEKTIQVRIDDKTKIKVLKTAVAATQTETDK